ncbi:hypothetical protein [Salinigranum salinum]|nr:hypothetical protein [Salinigranum salinum]
MAAAEPRRGEDERAEVKRLIGTLGVGYIPPHLRPDEDGTDGSGSHVEE